MENLPLEIFYSSLQVLTLAVTRTIVGANLTRVCGREPKGELYMRILGYRGESERECSSAQMAKCKWNHFLGELFLVSAFCFNRRADSKIIFPLVGPLSLLTHTYTLQQMPFLCV